MPTLPVVETRVDVLPSTDATWPWKVRVTTRDERGNLVGVTNLRALTEADANERAAMLRTPKK